MNKDRNSNDLFSKVGEQAQGFRTQLPENAWKRLENRLENEHKQKNVSFYRLFYNAAMISLVIAMLFVVFYYLSKSSHSPLSEMEQYTLNIEDLESNDNTYPVYDVHQLMNAYEKLLDSKISLE